MLEVCLPLTSLPLISELGTDFTEMQRIHEGGACSARLQTPLGSRCRLSVGPMLQVAGRPSRQGSVSTPAVGPASFQILHPTTCLHSPATETLNHLEINLLHTSELEADPLDESLLVFY